MLNLLFLGDIVGRPGREAVMKHLPLIQENYAIDITVVNGENSAGGRGISPTIAKALFQSGVDVITTGDHVWDQRELLEYLPQEPHILRPLNYPQGVAGNGSVVLETSQGKLAVLNAQGRTFMQPPLENPFLRVSKEVERLRDQEGVKMLFLDFHAEATSEKIAMGRAMDGRISAVIGTHTHVQTSDERIFEQGTAYLTDAGMCGPDHSILGCEVDPIVQRFQTALPARFKVAKGAVRLGGAVIEIDSHSGTARRIQRINELVE